MVLAWKAGIVKLVEDAFKVVLYMPGLAQCARQEPLQLGELQTGGAPSEQEEIVKLLRFI